MEELRKIWYTICKGIVFPYITDLIQTENLAI